jgi:hypothetical protein
VRDGLIVGDALRDEAAADPLAEEALR